VTGANLDVESAWSFAVSARWIRLLEQAALEVGAAGEQRYPAATYTSATPGRGWAPRGRGVERLRFRSGSA
jgi:hypothetical protein